MALYFLSLLGIPNIKIQRFSSINRKVGVKSSNNLITVNADRDLFVCLMSWALNCLQSHYHSLKEVIEKVFKRMLCSLLGKDIHVVQQLTASTNPKVVIINGLVVLHVIKSWGADTFGELFEKYFNIFSTPLFYNNSLQVYMVFDQYSNQRSCHSWTRTMAKMYFQSKRKGMFWIIKFCMFYFHHWFLVSLPLIKLSL